MTTFQDPPYQSRRAVRQSGHVDDVEVDAPVRPATSRTGRRAQLPSSTEWNADGTSPTAETSDAPSAPVAAAPLTLATPLQPQMPVYDTPPASDDAAADADSGATTPAPAAPQGRRASLGTGERHPATSVITAITPAESEPAEPATAETERTESKAAATEPAESESTTPEFIPAAASREEAPAAPAMVDAAPEASAPATDEPVVIAEPVAAFTPPTDRPMTRRELREARVAAERAAERAAGTSERSTGPDEVPEAIVSILNSGPIILPYLSSPATPPLSAEAREQEALAEFEALTREHEGDAAPIGADEHPAAPASTWAIPLEPTSASEPEAQDDESLVDGAAIENIRAELQADSAIDAEDEDDDVIDPSDKAETPAISVPEFVDTGQTPASNRGAGHWSVTPDTDEEIESLENTITRSVGAGSALTTSALVLPSIPQSSDRNSPYLATGETMLTGSIDLPRSLGSTGVHPSQVDNSDFDLDPLDHEVPSTDSAPVRAIRAVSTHTSSNGLITSKKPQGNHMLTVLVVSSSALAVVVLGLLVAGVSSGLFQ
jgi:hypothetical protein